MNSESRLRSCLMLACLLSAKGASAETSATQKAAAEALFQRAVELMSEGKPQQACPKFESSQQIDPALGTLLRLADCYEAEGKTASAWATFQQASSTAAAQGRSDREAIANERAHSLQQRLSQLELTFAAPVAESELHINGVLIPPASYDAALPVDPGTVTIEVSAPGYQSFSKRLEVPVGPASVRVPIPKLVRAVAPTPAPLPKPEPPPVEPGSGLRTAGFVTGGGGLAALVVAGVFTGQAYDKKQQSLDECLKSNANACTEHGVELRNEARDAGTRATIAGVTGGVLLAGGVTLLLIAPSHHEGERSMSLSTALAPGIAKLSLRGSF